MKYYRVIGGNSATTAAGCGSSASLQRTESKTLHETNGLLLHACDVDDALGGGTQLLRNVHTQAICTVCRVHTHLFISASNIEAHR